ncbi:MAG: hypothetical protein APF81_22795 [Desulfosporosinus sp. BRH_c37]|nr:MAG: hypothetical protein APF81_22795 [Desulfosporosinus sp. BRH_c37]
MAIERVLKDEDRSKIVLDYIMNPNKTDLVTGVNCVPETAFEEMLLVKAAYNKQDGRQFIHLVQSFHPAEQVTPQQVYEIGIRLAKEFERFSGFQIVVSTHLDREHLHNHFVFNTVNMETGLKWQQSPRQMQQLKDFSDELCKNYDLSIIEHSGAQRESPGEHRAKERGESWKHELRLAVDACKQNSTDRTNFIYNMQKLGYQVKWTDTRKDITFTTPEGKKCRNLRLDKALTKESLQEAFRLNKEFGNPKAMVSEIQKLELSTKVIKMMPVEDESIVEQTRESEYRDGQGEIEIEGVLITVEGNEIENHREQNTMAGDVFEEDKSKEDVIVAPQDILQDDLQEIAYIIEWSDRYKEARAYLYGSKEVEQNLTEAYRLFLKEAQIGNALALHDLGWMHMDGLGVEMNPEKAQEWYTKALMAFRAVEKDKSGSYPQYRIGKMYAAGLGTPQNYEAAADWFEMAVARNHKYAQYSLAGLYYRGQGVEQSHTTAFLLYGKSAAQGNPYASYELAKMYRDGLGCNKDTEKAEQYFKSAFIGFSALEADSHDDKLQYRLGQMLYMGTGTEKDAVKAVDYLEKSAKLGNVNAQYLLAKIFLEADSVPENVEKALEWLGKAAENGNAQAQYALGKLYRDGNHVEKDIVKAVALFKLSAEQGNQYAQYALGKIYLTDEGIPKDGVAAVKWLTLASDLGNQFAQYTLAKLYLAGEETPKDIELAFKLLTESANQQNQYAQYALGKLYLFGEEIPKDVEVAVKWLRTSAEQENHFAQYTLGKLYLEGKEVPKDVEAGLKLLTASAEQGNQFAQFQLGKIYLAGKEVEQDKALASHWLSLSAVQGNEYAQLLLEKMDSYNATELDFLLELMQFFSTQNHGQNQSRNYPLSHLEGHALREKILELQFGSSMNWNKGKGYDR